MRVAVQIHSRRSRRHDQRGSALVEFAIASVILLVLLFGIIEYGYVLSFKQGLTQAAAEGARAGAVGTDSAGIATAVNKAVGAFKQTCNTGGPHLQERRRGLAARRHHLRHQHLHHDRGEL